MGLARALCKPPQEPSISQLAFHLDLDLRPTDFECFQKFFAYPPSTGTWAYGPRNGSQIVSGWLATVVTQYPLHNSRQANKMVKWSEVKWSKTFRKFAWLAGCFSTFSAALCFSDYYQRSVVCVWLEELWSRARRIIVGTYVTERSSSRP